MNGELRSTYGWVLTPHARAAAARRNVPLRKVLETIAAPEIRHTSENHGPGRYVYKRGQLALAVDPISKTVITILWHINRAWSDEEFRAAMQVEPH